ncbi:MAG TPA: hypothetical protein VHQ98_07840 [Gaiellaceae bacterium]|jgi:hypothetical protein|nr:hypothetical protein [Gaiellaceae bacterium]
MSSWTRRPWAWVTRRRSREAFYPESEHSTEVERHIEVVDPSRHLGEEYPSIDVLRRYGRS